MKYDVEAAADELMLTPDEMKEVFECYFEEADELIASCREAIAKQNYVIVAKRIHALKGSSLNLRMDDIAEMVIALEELSKMEDGNLLTHSLTAIEQVIAMLNIEIDTFYKELATKG